MYSHIQPISSIAAAHPAQSHSTMWKPGTDAPPSKAKPNGSSSNNDEGQSPPKAKGPKKRLSSGTMGMRFMRRKAEAAEAAKQQAAEEDKTRAERGAMEWSTTTGRADGDGEAMSEDDDTEVVPLTASAVDVYGMGAAIVGRRSFGDFNKAVQDTWKEAVDSKARERSGARAERNNITDEELLQRYEKYVKGKGDMSNGKSASIGNLQKKRKKKNKDRGDKDKRQR